ncbi:DUF348 domain-containing protein [Heliobacterium gestii]|uniref:DUF348 domain-containing protein n=1 Tax=Heliomicrobium gestii TaxID=2699 RepID=A0A845LD42_HELGE|nr:3D domain-containing protein [Heliomicrobium gestii]MBM7866365.1 uncharacterized protein YabE (DUF348 family) [Heliomicrobium gestii]MZP42850.1 DUF348 domain-containing protein [Heliomicrobium gestii]
MLDDTTDLTERLHPGPPRRAKRLSDPPPGGELRRWGTALGLFAGIALVLFGIYSYLQKDIVLDVDGEQRAIGTFKTTVGEALAEAGVTLAEKDKVDPPVSTLLQEKLTVHIIRAFPIAVFADGKKQELITTPASVRDILAQTSIQLGALDRVEPALDQTVDKPSTVRIVRVTQEEVVEEETVPYRTEQKPDNTLEKGLRKIVSRGSTGLERNRMVVTYEDGEPVKKDLIAQQIVRSPVNQVVAMGTIDQVSRGGLNFHIREARYMVATAYSHTGRNTASGAYPEVGMVAVDTSIIPLGSRLYIEGYGFARAADRGSAIVGERIDVFVESSEEARRWGKRTTKVYVLE